MTNKQMSIIRLFAVGLVIQGTILFLEIKTGPHGLRGFLWSLVGWLPPLVPTLMYWNDEHTYA